MKNRTQYALMAAMLVLIYLAALRNSVDSPMTVAMWPIETVRSELTCQPEVFNSVFRKLSDALGLITETSSITEIDAATSKIKCIREWAQSLKDHCVRYQYLSWLSYFEKEYAGYRQHGGGNERLAAYEKEHPTPKPPSCERELIKKVKP